ncbi:hypothetical protein XthCFBP4691_04400 [Xanthomonas theicola]|uniref:Uncharacterized protein n=1 Tax=Xanthomonas theicola TaxID=56464 RepID=A0A2S6ZJG9_9XANT|nr:hypothetical protein XthCFBP4691_04400 [Xanthomonas theicola]
MVDMRANQRGEAMLMGGRRVVRGDVPIERVLQDFLMEALYLQEQLDDVPANQIGQAVGSDMQQVCDSGNELRNQIVEDMESRDALNRATLQPLLQNLDHTLGSVRASLNGADGQPSADDYRQEIDSIRRDFNAINSAAIDPSQNLAYSGELVGNPLQPR